MKIIMEGLMSLVIICDMIAYLPQIIKILRTKHTDDFSVPTWILWTTTSTIMFLYYIYITDIWLIFSELVCMLCNGIIFVLSLIYRHSSH